MPSLPKELLVAIACGAGVALAGVGLFVLTQDKDLAIICTVLLGVIVFLVGTRSHGLT